MRRRSNSPRSVRVLTRAGPYTRAVSAGPAAFVMPPPLREATVVVVTTAALHAPGDAASAAGDQSFRVLDGRRRDFRLGHSSADFDRSGVALDLNVAFPLDRLDEMAAAGEIERVADEHLSFLGAQDETMSTLRIDTGPAAARRLRAAGVTVVLVVPI